jgi:hypothetical protein
MRLSTRQLGELEATERVFARYSKGTRLKQTASVRTPATATKAAALARRRGRPPTTTAKAAGGKRSSSNLGDQVLALATGKTQQEIAAACKGARPTMSVPPFPATSGRAASKSAMGNSTPYSQRLRSNRLRFDTRIVARIEYGARRIGKYHRISKCHRSLAGSRPMAGPGKGRRKSRRCRSRRPLMQLNPATDWMFTADPGNGDR